jgi:dihydroneopterin aldolase
MKTTKSFFRRGAWALVVVVGSVLMMVGCLNTPLGNPEQSKMDAQFVGLWMNQEKSGEDQELYAAIPYDSRTYLLTQMIFHKSDGGAIQAVSRSVMKMWLTDVGGTTFMTAEWKDPEVLLKESTDYIVAKIARSGDRLTVQQVSEEFVKQANVQSAEALSKLIADNLKNPKLFEDKEFIYEKVGADRAEEMQGILKAFNHPGADGK